jgi:hypothetical protein
LNIERLYFGGGIEPSPTIVRQVSGMNKSMGMKNITARMARNQKIHFQPAYWERIPPRMGPREGARIGAREAMPM